MVEAFLDHGLLERIISGDRVQEREVGEVRQERAVAREEELLGMLIEEASGPVELDVSYGNVRAQRLYERLGFTVTGEKPAPVGSPLDGFRRMTLWPGSQREQGPGHVT